jgi:hypothetical protein
MTRPDTAVYCLQADCKAPGVNTWLRPCWFWQRCLHPQGLEGPILCRQHQAAGQPEAHVRCCRCRKTAHIVCITTIDGHVAEHTRRLRVCVDALALQAGRSWRCLLRVFRARTYIQLQVARYDCCCIMIRGGND